MDSFIHSAIQHQKDENEKVQQQLLEIQIQVNVVNSAICKSDIRQVVDKENVDAGVAAGVKSGAVIKSGAGVKDVASANGVIERWCMYQQQLIQLSHNLHTVQTEGSSHQRFLNYAHSQTHTTRDVPTVAMGNHQEQEVLQLVLEQNAFQERNCHLKEDIQNSINRALRHLSKMMQTKSGSVETCSNKEIPAVERNFKTSVVDRSNVKTPLADTTNMKTSLADRSNVRESLADGTVKTPNANKGNVK